MPKPRVFSPDEVIAVRKLAGVLTVEQLAQFFEVSTDTFKRVRDRQPEVEAAYRKGRANMIVEIVTNGIIMPARRGNITAAIFYLKTQAGWQEVNRHGDTDRNDSGVLVVNAPAQTLEDVSVLLRHENNTNSNA